MSEVLAQVAQSTPVWRPALTELSEFAGVAGAAVAVAHWSIKKGESWIGRVVDERRKARTGETAAPYQSYPPPTCRAVDLTGILSESVNVQRETATHIAKLAEVIRDSITDSKLHHANLSGDVKVLLDRGDRS